MMTSRYMKQCDWKGTLSAESQLHCQDQEGKDLSPTDSVINSLLKSLSIGDILQSSQKLAANVLSHKTSDVQSNRSTKTAFFNSKHVTPFCAYQSETASKRRSYRFVPYNVPTSATSKLKTSTARTCCGTSPALFTSVYTPLDVAELSSTKAVLDQSDFCGPLNIRFSCFFKKDSSGSCLEKRNWHYSCGYEAKMRQSHTEGTDTTVGELAGYLDELLYLPKDMSGMAQSMYM